MATLSLSTSYLNTSLTLLSAVSSKVNSTGYLTSVVDPENFAQQGSQSPEGQSFVVLAYAAYNDWVAMGKPGEDVKSPLGKESGAGRRMGLGRVGEVGLMAIFGVVAGFFGLGWVIA